MAQKITSFKELTAHLKNLDSKRRIALANAVDAHSLEAVIMAVEAEIAEAYLVGDAKVIKEMIGDKANLPAIHIIDVPEIDAAIKEAVRMVKEGEADVLMKGLVNTDVILRAVLDKERGLLKPGSVLTYNAALEIPGYHKLVFFSDPAVIPAPNLEQRVAMIKYAIESARKFGIEKPKVALIHATEKANPKVHFMQDYVTIMEMYRNGEFGTDVIIDGPIDIFLALSKEHGEIKKVDTPVLGDADVIIFPSFEAANAFYKGLVIFANTEMGGILQGTDKPVVLTSRSDSTQTKFYSIAVGCALS
ncbi:phosphate butyryltransferase [Paludibacteraceae bacterium OttesenSCG-928-F17]|nr:phosphate butyryltransferase [Paludibacteraceae bacterium OttesenSCG-928-F17]